MRCTRMVPDKCLLEESGWWQIILTRSGWWQKILYDDFRCQRKIKNKYSGRIINYNKTSFHSDVASCYAFSVNRNKCYILTTDGGNNMYGTIYNTMNRDNSNNVIGTRGNRIMAKTFNMKSVRSNTVHLTQ